MFPTLDPGLPGKAAFVSVAWYELKVLRSSSAYNGIGSHYMEDVVPRDIARCWLGFV